MIKDLVETILAKKFSTAEKLVEKNMIAKAVDKIEERKIDAAKTFFESAQTIDEESLDEKKQIDVYAAMKARSLYKKASKEKDPEKAASLKSKSDSYKKQIREDEQLNEISKKLASRYIGAAAADGSMASYQQGKLWNKRSKTSRSIANTYGRKYIRREKGIDKAVKKLAGTAKVPAK